MSDHGPLPFAEAPSRCRRCPRLVGLRKSLRREYPDWWNAPVPAFGDPDAWLAIVGLAPGKEGANRTGRPFTGDASGEMLFATLTKFGFVDGAFANDPGDGIALKGAIILNAVKCLPPGNKPTAAEISNCRPYIAKALVSLPKLRIILALGKVAHDSIVRLSGSRLADYKFAHGAVLTALGQRKSAFAFGHGALHALPGGLLLADSYHCSRYNVNTRLLTVTMFEDVFAQAVYISSTSRR